MTCRKAQRSSLGFSLAEVLIAMVIISVALLGILALQISSVRASTGSRGRETAVYLCQTLLDNVQTEAQRLNMASGFLIPGSNTAATTYFGAATTAGNKYFDINGNEVAVAAVNRVFTVSWSRLAPSDGAPKCFEFSTTASWSFEANASNVPVVKTLQVGRLVRID